MRRLFHSLFALFLVALAAMLISGCAGTDTEMRVYQARVAYDGSILNLAHQYWGLPLCEEVTSDVCQDEEVGLKIADADRVVERAFNDAELCVRASEDCDIEAALAAINGATAEVSRILSQEGITNAWLSQPTS